MLKDKGIEVIAETVDEVAQDIRDAKGMVYALQLAYTELCNVGIREDVINGMGVIIQQLEMFVRQADSSIELIA